MNSIKILHCSDLHLGSEFRRIGNQSATRRKDLKQTFLNILSLCKTEETELLLLSGDIFESWNIPQEIIQLVQEGLATIPQTQVIISAGNHDPLTPESAYLQKEKWSSNVHILPPIFGSILLDDLKVEIWGASFDTPYIHRSMLQPITPKQPDYLQIGVIHGTVGSDSSKNEYNPMSTNQIASSGLDYLALGHIHKPSGICKEGSTFYAYPGCPEGRGFDELGSRGVLLGWIEKGRCQLEFVPTCQRMYLEQEIDLSDTTSTRMASEKTLETLQKEYGSDYEKNLYKLILTGRLPDTVNLNFDTLKGLLNDLFYVKFRDHIQLEIDLEMTAKELSLKGNFVSKMLDHLQEENSAIAEQALKIGLKAFFGEVPYSED